MSRQSYVYDVIVLGAGPAGVSASIIINKAGFQVAILDQINEQQLKVGESVPGSIQRLLHRLGINGIEGLLNKDEFTNCSANASAWGTDDWTFQNGINNPEGGGWHLLRHRFDHELRKVAEQLGVLSIDGLADRVDDQNSEWVVRIKGKDKELRCRWLLDATGRKAFLNRRSGINRLRFSSQFAVIAWTKVGEREKDLTTRVKSVDCGWWYTSLLPGNIRVTALQALPEKAAQMIKQPEQFFDELNGTQLVNDKLSKANLIAPIIARDASVQLAETPYGNHWLAVGDAALSFDPLSSQGIFFAMYSGIKGAESIISCLTSPEDVGNYLMTYHKQVEQVFQANMKSRGLFYSSEPRFIKEDYWKTQLEMMSNKWTYWV